ncbi:MdtA/MuxA family multidrug efflux RND transporter periplasmic adaptor subunit [Verticiella sediminum]
MLAIVAGALYLLLRPAPSAPPVRGQYAGPVPVTVVPARRAPLPIHLDAVGTVAPLGQALVRSRVDGELLEIRFAEGQEVQAGELLAVIDPRPYEIALAQARGQLRQIQAQLRNARADLARFRTLHQQDSVARRQLETQEALVREHEGSLQAQTAAVDEAQLRLDYTRVVAPIGGRVGLRRAHPGNLIQAADADGIALITQTRPISVLFSVSETRMAHILSALRAGEALAAQAWDRERREVLATGQVRTFDNQIDPATGTLQLRAEFANTEERLFPSQFVNVRLQVRTLDDAVVIPVDAVQYGARGTYVYLVDGEDRARTRSVVLGPTADGEVAVSEGLAGGEQVVLEGLDRLSEGRAVAVQGAAQAAQSR